MPVETTEDRVVVLFGNANPQMQIEDTEGNQISVSAEHLNQSVTSAAFILEDPDIVEHSLTTDNDRMLIMVARGLSKAHKRYAHAALEAEQIMGVHAAGDAPAWVESENVELAAALAEHFKCPVGQPTMLQTETGRDATHEQNLKTGSQPAAFGYGALSASATAPKTTDTSVPEEIATAGGGLIRKAMTQAHTAGTNTSTMSGTWTANGSDALAVTVRKLGLLNKATSGGTLGYHDELSSSATLTASGDSLTVTWTGTIG